MFRFFLTLPAGHGIGLLLAGGAFFSCQLTVISCQHEFFDHCSFLNSFVVDGIVGPIAQSLQASSARKMVLLSQNYSEH